MALQRRGWRNAGASPWERSAPPPRPPQGRLFEEVFFWRGTARGKGQLAKASLGASVLSSRGVLSDYFAILTQGPAEPCSWGKQWT